MKTKQWQADEFDDLDTLNNYTKKKNKKQLNRKYKDVESLKERYRERKEFNDYDKYYSM
ncbi:hypothetical protein [Thalassotalea profundi]|uniref:DUF3545 family protein n=1 Tax=Thalassotalea profundi TaxID=2036687 RepID=A0ABQ3IG70_9GAMM|nr:hypothetical protein [Thalassotalea profundi]GHE78985.1 hypothetical protein GCM10011501_03630 [Thalassotalea profundi]